MFWHEINYFNCQDPCIVNECPRILGHRREQDRMEELRNKRKNAIIFTRTTTLHKYVKDWQIELESFMNN